MSALGLMPGLAVGHQRHAEGMDIVAAGVSHTHRQMIGIQVHANGATPFISNHRHIHHVRRGEHPPALLVTLEPLADRLTQLRSPRRLLAMLTTVGSEFAIALQRRQHLPVTVVEVDARNGQVLAVLGGQTNYDTLSLEMYGLALEATERDND